MEYKIRTEKDKFQENVHVFHGDQIAQFPLISAMYLRGITELLEKNWSNGSPFNIIGNGSKVIWGQNDAGFPLGGIVYDYNNYKKQGWIVLSFTDKEFRGRRIQAILQQAFEDEIIRIGGTSIASLIHKDNLSRLTSAKRTGMSIEYHRMYKDLLPTVESRKAVLVRERSKPWNEIDQERWQHIIMLGGLTAPNKP